MMKPVTSLFLLTGLALLPGCINRTVTIVPATVGKVVYLASGEPATGARVSAPGTDISAETGPLGEFQLAALTRKRSEVVLPASGVYVDGAALMAEAGEARAYGWAQFISTSDTAMTDVTLFLIPRGAAFDGSGVPEDCTLEDDETYALQMLAAAPSGALQAWLDSGIEHGDQLDQLLGVALVGNLSRRCDVPTVQTRDWSAQIDALTGEE